MIKYYQPSIFNAFNICERQAWLMVRQITADQGNEFLEIGRFIDEISFKREKKKIRIGDIEAILDLVSKKDGHYYIAEIKKSSKVIDTSLLQLRYYLFMLKIKKGIIVNGMIKIPKERISKKVYLKEEDEKKIILTLKRMNKILSMKIPPKYNKLLPFCKKCAFNEFCWAEIDE